jgi:hypothetical protein
MVYRGTEAKMSGYAHEWKAREDEGARAAWQAQPVATARRRQGHRRALPKPRRRSKSRSPGPSTSRRPIWCCSRSARRSSATLVAGLDGITHRRRSRRRRRARLRPAARAGTPAGDCANGGKEVVNAAAEGATRPVRDPRFVSGSTQMIRPISPRTRRASSRRTRSGSRRPARPTRASRSCGPSTRAGAARCGRRSATRSSERVEPLRRHHYRGTGRWASTTSSSSPTARSRSTSARSPR